jgi:hypothetical protein
MCVYLNQRNTINLNGSSSQHNLTQLYIEYLYIRQRNGRYFFPNVVLTSFLFQLERYWTVKLQYPQGTSLCPHFLCGLSPQYILVYSGDEIE